MPVCDDIARNLCQRKRILKVLNLETRVQNKKKCTMHFADLLGLEFPKNFKYILNGELFAWNVTITMYRFSETTNRIFKCDNFRGGVTKFVCLIIS